MNFKFSELIFPLSLLGFAMTFGLAIAARENEILSLVFLGLAFVFCILSWWSE